eukprot:766515-Hanusia_phi.AAC.5
MQQEHIAAIHPGCWLLLTSRMRPRGKICQDPAVLPQRSSQDRTTYSQSDLEGILLGAGEGSQAREGREERGRGRRDGWKEGDSKYGREGRQSEEGGSGSIHIHMRHALLCALLLFDWIGRALVEQGDGQGSRAPKVIRGSPPFCCQHKASCAGRIVPLKQVVSLR